MFESRIDGRDKTSGNGRGRFLLWTLLCGAMEHRLGVRTNGLKSVQFQQERREEVKTPVLLIVSFPQVTRMRYLPPFMLHQVKTFPCVALLWTVLTTAPHFPEVGNGPNWPGWQSDIERVCVTQNNRPRSVPLRKPEPCPQPDVSPLPILAGLSGKEASTSLLHRLPRTRGWAFQDINFTSEIQSP